MLRPDPGAGPPTPTAEALAIASAELAVLAAGPYSDIGTVDAAVLVADTVSYLGTAAREGGIAAASTVSTVMACLVMTFGRLPPLLTRAGDWLSAEITAGRVTGSQPPAELAASAREAAAAAADCARQLAGALADARELARALLGPEPDFRDRGLHDDLDMIRAASLGYETADYLTAAVQRGGVTGTATLTGVTVRLASAASQLPPLLTRAGDWLSAEVTAGRVTGSQPPAELAADVREAIQHAAWLAACLARALHSARNLTAGLRRPGETAGPPPRPPRQLALADAGRRVGPRPAGHRKSQLRKSGLSRLLADVPAAPAPQVRRRAPP